MQSVFAVGAGNERVELWGVKGRLLRMAMPNGAGLFAATFMHHRVDMLTVEFGDQNGGYHAAVFFLPGKEAARAAQIIAAAPIAHREPASATCPVQGAVESASVRVPLPTWNDDQVPAAYRALLYEHLIADLRASHDVQRVYRDGETHEDGACAQYTLQIAITGFSKGNQVVRASTGPVGFFVDTTKLVFDVKLSRADGATALRDQIKTTVRGETESVKVAESMARRVVKEFAASQVQLAQTEPVRAPGAKAFR